MKRIKLTKGKHTIVDDDRFEELNQYCWQACTNKAGNCYARRTFSKPERDNGSRRYMYMHQQVLGCGRGVDHINGNGLDNRRENLRKADQSVNNQNKRKKPGTSSKYLGVSWWEPSKKWKAQIKIPKGPVTYLGLFTDEIEAAKAYDSAARKLYSGYVKTNFQEEK